MRYRIVDVFSERPLGGNALCVVIDSCPDDVMQPIAREVNLSETTFPTVTGPDAYRMRIFTPWSELPFAGHPTLGTAWALGPGRWTQETAGATVIVEADADGAEMTQPAPTFAVIDPIPGFAALGLRKGIGVWVAEAAGNRIVIALTDDDLAALAPDGHAVAEVGNIVAAVHRVDDRHLHVRVFCPGVGIAEDPGTGSAAGPIAVLARRELGTDVDVTIRQGDEIGRPCRITAHAVDGDLRVGGRVVACAEGRFVGW